ncbi:hypothetical protein HN371_05325 [Candidatus Poribacteria bacterium]|jgi:hypothetical protein|nr:hypothetical protein [Candidatus Poribacteria bacterium]MBT5534438.1 hypothetical protein [Candidatus Poribacteria bacterium]MBT5709466.1 hypothetical protein [Candidatus Poribacteria bacterium]MBT7099309.1 hypothetical protein [Candidatus Poribacteria bacterium]MBT7809497.1 hypothetical protein [Candidatus Poribacteria bacterium]
MRCLGGARRHRHIRALLACCPFVFLTVFAAAVPTRDIAPSAASAQANARIVGKVTWDGHGLDSTILYLYRDPTLKSVYRASPLLSDGGGFSLDVDPGTYYVAAVLDRNRSGALDVGDALGIYGIRSWGDTAEHKLPIEVGAGQRASNVNISISALRVSREGRHSMVALAEAYAAELAPPATPRTSVVRGSVAGMPAAADEAIPTYAYAYADLSWRRLIDGAPVAADGTFELRAPPGKAYIAAIADSNRSNVFDTGDAFGYFSRVDVGESGSGRALPAPVAVRAGETREGVEVVLRGRRSADGGLVGLDTPAAPSTETSKRTVTGRVEWPGHPPARATVEFYADAALLVPVTTVVAGPTGEFAASVPEGQYYVVANVDVDANGYVSAGDGIGGHGTSDITSFPPRPYAAEADAADLSITVSGAFSASGMLLPVESEGDAPTATEEYDVASGIMGRILWDGHAAKEAWLLISESTDFADATMLPVVLDGFGNFVVALPEGAYYVMAIVDAAGDEQVGAGDGVAVYGARVAMDAGDTQPSRVLVWSERVTPYVHLSVSAVYTGDGSKYAALDDGSRTTIRRSLGEPNDRYRWTRGGRLVEEWRYWTEGVAFTFAANGPGWTQIGSEEFTPNRSALERMRPADIGITQSLIAQSTVDAAVYYETEGVVWAFTPDGSQKPVTVGSEPRATPGGLLYRDEAGDLMLLDAESGASRLAMPGASNAHGLAFTGDDATVAYVRDGRLLVKHRSGDERVAPTEDLVGVSSPAWDRRGRVLAFSAIGPSGGGTSIYAYDPARSHLEPLVEEAGDDLGPVWSPTAERTLAFTRVVGGIGQVWVTTFSESGEQSSTQLTEYGGAEARWLPDGSGLVYEADGQIWTVDVASKAARPLLVNGEPVLGGRPMVLPLSR